MLVTRRAVVAGSLAVSAATTASRRGRAADALAPPTGTPVLTVSGAIEVTNVGKMAVFDMASLEALGLSHFITATPWDQGKVTYEGVHLDTLLRRVGAHGTQLTAIALDDYVVDLPISDFAKYGTLLATRRNGKYMPVSDKGPLFIVYPFDDNTDLQQAIYYSRCVWQISQFVVK